ncbi:MAG: hypothetical protein OXI22_07175 [Defluviicoccus sp.]|nr:hypothetical protein [Defluviicoccus sp.]MDE0383646.1 hypothetical protein [Defluviicoccus sp.]
MSSGGQQATPPFLRGSFRTCPLSELFGVLAVSRQLLEVRFSCGEREVGAIAIKAGQVVRAGDFRSEATGGDALNALIGDPGTAFSVVMLPPNAPEAQNDAPLCGLAELLPEEDGANHAAAEPPSGEVIGTDEIFEVSGPQFSAESPQHDAVEVAPATPPEPEAAHPARDAELLPLGGEPPGAAAEAKPPEMPTPELPPAADAIEVAPALPPEPEAAPPAGDAELPPLGAAIEAAPPEAPTPEVPPAADAVEPAAPLPPEDDDPIMQGRMDDSSFDEILEVLQLSDRCVVVSFLRGDAEVGAMMVESGQVVAAAAGGRHGMEAFRQLCADHGETFEIRNGTAEDAGEPLGGVPELLAAMRQPAPAPATPDAPQSRGALFLRGRIADFPLDLLIGALDLSRQPIDIEFRRGEAILHRVHVKAGMIVGAESVAGDGAAPALAAIRGDPGGEFRVYRRSTPLDGEPFAPLAALVPEPERPGEPERQMPAPDPPTPAPAPVVAARDATVPETSAPAAPGTAPEIAPSAEPTAGLEAFRDRAIAEIRAALAAPDRGRRERVLLWSSLGLQIACLAIVLGAIVLSRL